MRTALFAFAVLAPAASLSEAEPTEAVALATRYEVGETLRVEVHSRTDSESEMEFVRDGESGGVRESASSEEIHLVCRDTVLEATDGVASRLRREFEAATRTSESDRGERETTSPLEGVTLELTDVEGETEVEVVDGAEPDDDALLERHRIALAVDALLFEDAVERGATWELDDERVRRVLGIGLESVLFPREEAGFERDAGAERGGRRRLAGGRGGAGLRFLAAAEWDAEVTLVAVDEEHEGETCARIEFTFTSEGDLPEREGGGFGGRGDRGGEDFGTSTSDGTFEVEVEGSLLFSLDSKRPLLLELEGSYETESTRTREFGDRSMEILQSRRGSLSRTVAITLEPSES